MRAVLQEKIYGAMADLALPFHLRILSGGCGFFGDVAIALNGIRFAELHGLGCSVDWGSRSLYFDPGRGMNAWTEFFKESHFQFGASDRRKPPLTLPLFPMAHDFVCYDRLDRRRSLHRAINRFCTINASIAARVDAYTTRHFSGGKTLGVHVRMTDAARGQENRATVTAETFILEARTWLAQHPEATIFLATDDADVASRFVDTFGERVHMQDCTRSTDGTSIHGHYDRGSDASPYLKGVEVLVDALILARCNHLLRVHSRVTWFSLCANPDLTFTDLGVKHRNDVRMKWLQQA